MKWPKIFTRIEEHYVPEIINEESKGPKPVNEELQKAALERVRETLKNWADAVESAEQLEPDYSDLLNLYNNITLDPHVTALTDSILYDITQTPFHIVGANGEVDEDKTKLFQKSWFHDFIRYYLEADYYGYSLIQLIKEPPQEGDQPSEVYTKAENVDRYHIDLMQQGIKKDPAADEVDFYFNKPPLSDWTVFAKSNIHLGRFNNVAKSFIMKREVEQFWAVYNELFTTPYVYAKTDFNNKKHRNDLINLFTKRKHSGFGIIGLEDELAEIITYSGAGWNSYKSFLEYANKQISKAFLGQTMVFEDGSSRSQAEVHERQKDTFVQARRVAIQFIINEELIPKMVKAGMPIAIDDSFEWHFAYEITPEQWAKIIQMLAGSFDMDETEISEKIGIDLKTKKQQQLPSSSDNNITNYSQIAEQLKKIYNV